MDAISPATGREDKENFFGITMIGVALGAVALGLGIVLLLSAL